MSTEGYQGLDAEAEAWLEEHKDELPPSDVSLTREIPNGDAETVRGQNGLAAANLQGEIVNYRIPRREHKPAPVSRRPCRKCRKVLEPADHYPSDAGICKPCKIEQTRKNRHPAKHAEHSRQSRQRAKKEEARRLDWAFYQKTLQMYPQVAAAVLAALEEEFDSGGRGF